MMRPVSRGVGFLALILVGLVFVSPAAAEIGIMDNKLISGAFIIRNEQQGGYVLMSANNGDGNIPAYTNTALSNDGWVSAGDALPTLPTWAQSGKTWRPSLISVDRTYLLYYSATNAATGNHCIGVATSTNVTGPFSNPAKPLICVQGREVIDPYPFLDDDGQLYLTWKLASTNIKIPPIIYMTPLGAKGLAVTGTNTQLITVDQPWEGVNVEAPYLTKRSGLYYLFYSGALFQRPNYGVGYAVSSTVTGPYSKNPSNPIIDSSSGLGIGPGEETIFRDQCGNSWLGFSDYDNETAQSDAAPRHFHAVQLVWPTKLNEHSEFSLSIDPASDFSLCNPPVYRFYSGATGEHFFSLSHSEGTDAGFQSEGVGFNVFNSTSIPGTAPIYRCYWPAAGMHFISVTSNCEDQVVEGTYGNIYTSQVPDSVPLYRMYNPVYYDHLETTNAEEGYRAGYNLEGILGYVPQYTQ